MGRDGHWWYFLLLLLIQLSPSLSNDFDPYQLNGGLVAAVAGRDYCLIAVDTRLIGANGYDILERRHLQSRLWTATTPIPISNPHSSADTKPSLTTATTDDLPPSLFAADGSLIFPKTRMKEFSGQRTDVDNTPKVEKEIPGTSRAILTKALHISDKTCASQSHASVLLAAPPVLIGSAGCQADCEFLKRRVRFEVRRSQQSGELLTGVQRDRIDDYYHYDLDTHQSTRDDDLLRSIFSKAVPTMSIAVLLAQVLYERRGFPWYSFCVVGGLQTSKRGRDGSGQVFVYDAIGSYESVAVATGGIGRELLQPILDRSFSILQNTNMSQQKQANPYLMRNDSTERLGIKDATSPAIGLLSTSANPLVVEQSAEEASEILVQAFRAVSERQATVGDHVVLCCVQREYSKTADDPTGLSEPCVRVWTLASPLKIH